MSIINQYGNDTITIYMMQIAKIIFKFCVKYYELSIVNYHIIFFQTYNITIYIINIDNKNMFSVFEIFDLLLFKIIFICVQSH
jgi:hypothetical protein